MKNWLRYAASVLALGTLLGVLLFLGYVVIAILRSG